MCVVPGEVLCGGPVRPPCEPCGSDADCASHGPDTICAMPACQTCTTCIPGCQRVLPKAAEDAGFSFRYPNIDAALANLLA